MKRVFILIVLLISTYVFEIVFLYPGNITDEAYYYRDTTQVSVTNTTIYKDDLQHYYKSIKTLEKTNFDNLNKKISNNQNIPIQNFNSSIENIINEMTINLTLHNFERFRLKNDGIKGIYVNGYDMNNEIKINKIKNILVDTNVNTLVIDVKTDNGHILFDSETSEVAELNNERIKYDAETLNELKNLKELYLIGRVVVFQDPLFAKSFSEEAIFDSKKNTIYSQNNQYFLDPSSKKVREYIISIAIEACKLGFNEIQFDYIRYPDSNYKHMVFKESSDYENRVKTINTFLSKATELLHNEGCLVSADIFGYVLTNKLDGGIGQNLESIIKNVDFISPMVYPSHYSNNSFGYANPNNHPYEIVSAALSDGLERGVSERQLRPFLQGFWHTIKDVQDNIKAAENKKLDWLIWNNSSVYELDYFSKLES